MDVAGYLSDRPTVLREIREYLKDKTCPSIEGLTLDPRQRSLTELSLRYIESVLEGRNHVFTEDLMRENGYSEITNVCIPLVHRWTSSFKLENLVILSHPEDVERICKNHIKKAPIFEKLLHSSIISTTDNEDWQEQRGNANFAFIPKLSLQKVFPISRQRAEACSRTLRELSRNGSIPVNMSDFFLRETMAQLQLSMFGLSEAFEMRTNRAFRRAFSGVGVERLEGLVKDTLSEIEGGEAKGPLTRIFGTSDPLKEAGNATIMMFAGHDTTGHTLTWLLYELCQHPHYKQKLYAEIDAYWRHHAEPTYDTFRELPFLTRCLTETLRMWPALANGTYRELEHEETIHGLHGSVKVPKGTLCQIPNWTRHRSTELWGEDAAVFNPEREYQGSEIWEEEGFNTYTVSSERYSPFTYGPRNCVGKNFSQMEMRLILLYLFRDYDFQMTEAQEETTRDPTYRGLNGFTMGPASIHKEELYGMEMRVIRRRSAL